MEIRLARESDYTELMTLYDAFVGSDRYSGHGGDSFQRVLHSKDNFIYVAEDEGMLVGFATFSVRVVIRYPKPIAELDELFVEEKYRRQKLGQTLLNTVLKKAKELGCHRLFIESHYDHKAAHTFYESTGFTNYGYHFIKDL